MKKKPFFFRFLDLESFVGKMTSQRTENCMGVTDVTRLLRACFVVIFTNINVFWSFTKRSVWRKLKFGEKLFQTKLLSRLSQKVCRLLSSPFLLRKVHYYGISYDGNWKNIAKDLKTEIIGILKRYSFLLFNYFAILSLKIVQGGLKGGISPVRTIAITLSFYHLLVTTQWFSSEGSVGWFQAMCQKRLTH